VEASEQRRITWPPTSSASSATYIGRPIIEYIERIDATLAPFRGRFAAQDMQAELLEGDASAFVVIVEFPDLGDARGWYDSEAYRSIRPLRAENSATTLFIVRGVGPDHRATDILGRPPEG
jgi:uncharacterized protein (DUF1330 family)